jgi:hypothetical protein
MVLQAVRRGFLLLLTAEKVGSILAPGDRPLAAACLQLDYRFQVLHCFYLADLEDREMMGRGVM